MTEKGDGPTNKELFSWIPPEITETQPTYRSSNYKRRGTFNEPNKYIQGRFKPNFNYAQKAHIPPERKKYLNQLLKVTSYDLANTDLGEFRSRIFNHNEPINYLNPKAYAESTRITLSHIIKKKLELFIENGDELIHDVVSINSFLTARYNHDLPPPPEEEWSWLQPCTARCQNIVNITRIIERAKHELTYYRNLSYPQTLICELMLFRASQIYTRECSMWYMQEAFKVAKNPHVQTSCNISLKFRDLLNEIKGLREENNIIKAELKKIHKETENLRAMTNDDTVHMMAEKEEHIKNLKEIMKKLQDEGRAKEEIIQIQKSEIEQTNSRYNNLIRTCREEMRKFEKNHNKITENVQVENVGIMDQPPMQYVEPMEQPPEYNVENKFPEKKEMMEYKEKKKENSKKGRKNKRNMSQEMAEDIVEGLADLECIFTD